MNHAFGEGAAITDGAMRPKPLAWDKKGWLIERARQKE
jgi:hypothetical protein